MSSGAIADARPIVFLHVPKTAGQTVHHALVSAVGGKAHVSPVRVHTQAGPTGQYPPGYRLYSGHLDWDGLGSMRPHPFAFTILRDPRERLASFYFYLEAEARKLSPEALAAPQALGKRRLLEHSADEYFLGGDTAWQTFVRDHYDNFYCAYFGSGRVRAGPAHRALDPDTALARARAGLDRLDRVYFTDRLGALEDDIASRYGVRVSVQGTYRNVGTLARDTQRWPRLMARLEHDANRAALEAFVERDLVLWDALRSADA